MKVVIFQFANCFIARGYLAILVAVVSSLAQSSAWNTQEYTPLRKLHHVIVVSS